MRHRTAVTLMVAGLVAGLALGSTAIGFAATNTATATAPSQSASGAPVPGGPGGGGPGGPGGPRGRGPGGPGGGMMGVSMVDVVAKLTGETTSTVSAARQKGTSFAKIASDKGVTVAQVVELASAAPKAALASEVSNGLIDQTKSDTLLKDLTTHLTQEVNSTGTPDPGRGPGHGAPPAGSMPPTGTPAPAN